MPKEIQITGYQCNICSEKFADFDRCYQHEDECSTRKYSTPDCALVGVVDGKMWMYTRVRDLYLQEDDHMKLVGNGVVGIPTELAAKLPDLYMLSFDEKLGKWTEDEIPF